MTATIQKLSKPAIHYKVLAAGRNNPATRSATPPAICWPQDAACVGIYPSAAKPKELEEDLRLLEDVLKAKA